jgi:hypothetical protein
LWIYLLWIGVALGVAAGNGEAPGAADINGDSAGEFSWPGEETGTLGGLLPGDAEPLGDECRLQAANVKTTINRIRVRIKTLFFFIYLITSPIGMPKNDDNYAASYTFSNQALFDKQI